MQNATKPSTAWLITVVRVDQVTRWGSRHLTPDTNVSLGPVVTKIKTVCGTDHQGGFSMGRPELMADSRKCFVQHANQEPDTDIYIDDRCVRQGLWNSYWIRHNSRRVNRGGYVCCIRTSKQTKKQLVLLYLGHQYGFVRFSRFVRKCWGWQTAASTT